ncbi:hypothetical protein C4565_00745 [Candidatus Parcubacteria bacterium]|nr:MAG: hypothetical protein C4565_00745 [Candidatus Parcubacteria bacterium]
MDPEIVANWQKAKREAAVLAKAIGASLIQMPGGMKRILHNGKVIDCSTWLGAYSYCYRIDCDRKKNTTVVPVAQPWTGPLPPGGALPARRMTKLVID